MGSITEDRLQTISCTTWGSTDTAGQIDEKRVLFINCDTCRIQLGGQFACRCAVAEEQHFGAFVIHEVNNRIAFSIDTGVLNRSGVVSFMLNHLDAETSQTIYFPLFGIG
ncbi:hypothetical protein D3C76_1209780 [compost metagenome]